jgi:sulfate adenylyltransferase subunit 1
VHVNTLEQKPAATLGLNAIGVTRLELDRPASFDPYRQNRETGSFIIIDRFTNATVAAGMVIAASPDTLQQEELREDKSKRYAKSDFAIKRIDLRKSFISGDEGNLVDLTEEHGEIQFVVSAGFLDFLAQGNRVLFCLRDQQQLPPVALIAYEHALQFNFKRDGDRINLVLFSDSVVTPTQTVSGDVGL